MINYVDRKQMEKYTTYKWIWHIICSPENNILNNKQDSKTSGRQ